MKLFVLYVLAGILFAAEPAKIAPPKLEPAALTTEERDKYNDAVIFFQMAEMNAISAELQTEKARQALNKLSAELRTAHSQAPDCKIDVLTKKFVCKEPAIATDKKP